MIRVGLTGNIGSGKTTVARIFEVMGVPVFYADIVARSQYNKEEVKLEVVEKISPTVLVDNEIDTKILAGLIFKDKKLLDRINGIIHPRVFEEYENWCELHNADNYTINESAIIFENNLQHRYQYVINVSAPEQMRIDRVINRDNSNRENVVMRIKNQLDDKVKSENSDFIIYNDGSEFLIPQVLSIHQQILREVEE